MNILETVQLALFKSGDTSEMMKVGPEIRLLVDLVPVRPFSIEYHNIKESCSGLVSFF